MKPKPFRPEAYGEDGHYVRDAATGLVWHRCGHRTLYADTDTVLAYLRDRTKR